MVLNATFNNISVISWLVFFNRNFKWQKIKESNELIL
jgi:hypothetical protein